jgi:polyhydroxyalkanoate synthesis regulator phasin
MASNERIRKYLDAGSVLGQVTRGRAEEIVRELVNAGEIPRGQAQEWVDTMVERSKKTSENLLELVRREVHTQLSKIDSASVEQIANQVAEVLKKSAEVGRNATAGATRQATQAAKDATAGATKAAKDATAGATKVAKEARQQAERTATRAKDAAEAAVPKRGKSKKSKDHKKDGHKKPKAQKDKAEKDKAEKDKTEKAEKAKDTDEAVSETKTAPKKAS